jgi:hypothetical protein
MKTKSVIAILLFVTACASQQANAYKTLGALVTAVDSGMKVYGNEVQLGHVAAADQNKVKAAYETYQRTIGPVIAAKGLTGPVPDSVAAAASSLLGLLQGLGVIK